MKISHRDLKPENFMFLKESPSYECNLKVIDFGLSKTYEQTIDGANSKNGSTGQKSKA
jgi:serine/threonine protein kinase